jgi:hypothetical protein
MSKMENERKEFLLFTASFLSKIHQKGSNCELPLEEGQ